MKVVTPITLLLLISCLVWPIRAISTEHSVMDRQGQFMAVYLFHFANFIDWPEDAFKNSKEFHICIIGDSEINAHIDEINGEIVHGRKLIIHHMNSSHNIQSCQIAFLSRKSKEEIKTIKQAILNKKVLLVSDRKNAIEEGSIVEYFVENNKLKIAICVDGAKESKLKISSKLLRIAKLVNNHK